MAKRKEPHLLSVIAMLSLYRCVGRHEFVTNSPCCKWGNWGAPLNLGTRGLCLSARGLVTTDHAIDSVEPMEIPTEPEGWQRRTVREGDRHRARNAVPIMATTSSSRLGRSKSSGKDRAPKPMVCLPLLPRVPSGW